VDIVIPNKYEGMDSHLSAEELTKTLQAMVPVEHLDFAKKVLADHGVPIEDADGDSLQLLGWTEATATRRSKLRCSTEDDADRQRARNSPPT